MIGNKDFYFRLDDNPVLGGWLVDGIIPLGGYLLMVAQAGVGKSFFLEALAVAVSCGGSFLGRATLSGEVLLVDEDSDHGEPEKRIARLLKFYPGCQPKLIVKVREGYRVSGGDTSGLLSLIKRFDSPELKLIILESLQGLVGGKTSLDNSQDASALMAMVQALERGDRTVIVSHHISKNKSLSVDTAMTCDNTDSLVMNNTVIVSKSKGYYVLASPDKGKELKRLAINPVSRRVVLPRQFWANIVDDAPEGEMHFEHGGDYFIAEADGLAVWEKRVLSLFVPIYKQDDDGSASLAVYTVKSLLEKSAEAISPNTMRDRLDKLERDGYVKVYDRKDRGGRIYYCLTDEGLKFVSSLGTTAPKASLKPSKARKYRAKGEGVDKQGI